MKDNTKHENDSITIMPCASHVQFKETKSRIMQVEGHMLCKIDKKEIMLFASHMQCKTEKGGFFKG